LIQRFWCRWRRLTPDRSDFWRQVLLFGWQDKKIDTDFDYTIPTRLPPVRQRTAFHSVYEELEAMSVIGPSERGTATTYVFPVPKDDGTQRFVADLTHHNLNEVVPHFQGSTESSLLEWLRVGTFRITGDLSKQYWQIPARKSQQRLMVFPAPEGKGFLQWRVLTMGAKGACRVGATMTSLVLGVARARMQIDFHTYMDEYCIQHDHCLMALLQQMAVMMLFRFLGARLNLVKSMAMPLEVVPFIGLQLSSHYNQVGPSLARLTKIRAAAEAMLRPGLPSKRQLASLVGQVRSLLRSHQLAGFASARLSEALAQMVRRLGPQAHSARMEASLRQWIQPELRYWAESHPQHEWRFCSVVANPVRLVVDSSMYGWAGEEILSVGTPFRASGFFTPEERSGWWHDTHECSGLAQTVLAWLKTTQRQREGQIWQPRLLVIGTDNITTKVAAVKRRSRSLQVSAVMKDLIPQVHQLGFDLTAYHIDKLTMDTQFPSVYQGSEEEFNMGPRIATGYSAGGDADVGDTAYHDTDRLIFHSECGAIAPVCDPGAVPPGSLDGRSLAGVAVLELGAELLAATAEPAVRVPASETVGAAVTASGAGSPTFSIGGHALPLYDAPLAPTAAAFNRSAGFCFVALRRSSTAGGEGHRQPDPADSTHVSRGDFITTVLRARGLDEGSVRLAFEGRWKGGVALHHDDGWRLWQDWILDQGLGLLDFPPLSLNRFMTWVAEQPSAGIAARRAVKASSAVNVTYLLATGIAMSGEGVADVLGQAQRKALRLEAPPAPHPTAFDPGLIRDRLVALGSLQRASDEELLDRLIVTMRLYASARAKDLSSLAGGFMVHGASRHIFGKL